MNVSIASDHGGWELKTELIAYLNAMGHTVIDNGTHGADSVDYTDYAAKTVSDILEQRAERGILICGTGIGMSIAANRYQGIRAALCHRIEYASLCRQHNDANILVLGGRFISVAEAQAITDLFIETPFEGGRHIRRIEKIESCGR